MEFEGEHLLPGQIGHFLVITALVASLVATIGYFKASLSRNLEQRLSWTRFSSKAYFVHVFSVLGVFALIVFICSNHYYEYHYAYKHTSSELEYKYLLASIWEGQEGSFLLWSIWHCVLGSILIFKAKDWTAPVMSMFSAMQFFLTLMILGIYFFGKQVGSDPFALTRNVLDLSSAPVFTDIETGLLKKNYLSFLKDGVGLNVLLRNYWMVIHPPILFLGFASTLIPFSFAYAGLVTNRIGDWVKPALPWTVFSAGILGVGIMMGGKWAYESLSFGGYWGWDPVENASLVPWMILIAGLHTMMIYKATGRSLRASYLFIFLTLGFVLYSTYLTRTGVLGDTSVHAFTEKSDIMKIMIFTFMAVFSFGSLILLISKFKKIPHIPTEEKMSSREFWMFIGAVLFFLTALFIIGKTSVPVYNKLLGLKIAAPEDVEYSYNKVVIIVAVIIGILTAITHYFKYKQTEKSYITRKLIIPSLIGLAICGVICFVYPLNYYKHGTGFLAAIYVALVAAVFSAITNASYIWIVMKGNLKSAGGSITHFGFTLMLAGMLISSANKKVLTDSRANNLPTNVGMDPMTRKQDDPLENLTLLREIPSKVGDYSVTYLNKKPTNEKTKTVYELMFAAADKRESFKLQPDVYTMKDNTISSNPDTRNYWNRDIFTYITALSGEAQNDTAQYRIAEIGVGEKAFYSKGYIQLNAVVKNPNNARFSFGPNDAALMADLTIVTRDSMKYNAVPLLYIKDSTINFVDDTAIVPNLYFRFAGVSDTQQKIRLAVKESNAPAEFITIKAYEFPFIGLVWIGLIILTAGFTLSVLNRVKAATWVAALVMLAVLAAMIKMFLFAG